MGAVDRVDLDEVAVAALGHEPGLGHHREPERRELARQRAVHHRPVLDAVAGERAGRPPRGQGQDERFAGHAVHRDGSAVSVRVGDPGDHLVERREPVVGEEDLHGAAEEAGGHLDPGQGRSAGDLDVLREVAASVGGGQDLEVVGALDGGGVGDARHAVGAQRRADGPQVGDVLRRQAVPEPAVGAEEATVPLAVLADGSQRGGVEHPERPAPVLDPQGARGHDLVESHPVEIAGDALVVADGPQPRTGGERGVGSSQRRHEPTLIEHLGRPDADRPTGGGHGDEVHVVVVEAREDGTPAAVDDLVTSGERDAGRDLGDDPVDDPDVHHGAVDIHPPEAEGAHAGPSWSTVRVLELSAAELFDRLAVGSVDEDLLDPTGVVVVLGPDPVAPERMHELAARVGTLPAILVAPPTLAAVADVVPEAAGDVDGVTAAVEGNPLAATALVLHLRHGDGRSVASGLVAESAVYSTLQGGPEFTAWRAARPRREPPPDEGPAIRCERDGARLEIRLHRPARRNALSARMRDEWLEALAVAAVDGSVAEIHLRGEGASFCSGGDLDEFGTFPDPATAHLVRVGRSVGAAIHAVAGRVVAHLHGACIGSGIELPAFAGRVLAAPDTRISLPEVTLGLVPGAGGTVSLPRRIGRHRTALLALTGRTIDVTTAVAWGLVDEVEPGG